VSKTIPQVLYVRDSDVRTCTLAGAVERRVDLVNKIRSGAYDGVIRRMDSRSY
jgi:hypothetical protein